MHTSGQCTAQVQPRSRQRHSRPTRMPLGPPSLPCSLFPLPLVMSMVQTSNAACTKRVQHAKQACSNKQGTSTTRSRDEPS